MKETILENLKRKNSLVLIALLNLIGTGFGFYYYIEQLSFTPAHLWLFVPASPIATTLVALSFIMKIKGLENQVVDSLAFISSFKYGLWTVFVLIYYFEIFYSSNSILMYIFLVVSHLFMLVQSFLVLELSEIKLKWFAVGFTWYLFNDFIDYTLGTHTWIYTGDIEPAMYTAFISSFLALISYYIWKEEISLNNI